MTWFNRKDDLESRLRAERPVARREFVSALAAEVDAQRDARRPRPWRLAFAGSLTAALLVALASVGGLSAAASSGWKVVASAKRVVTPAKQPQSVANSSAAAQYGHKVTICHKGHTISVDEHAVPAHRKHGDTIGPCPTGAVAGANAALTNGRGNSVRGGVLGTTARGGNLPFTGASLGVAVVVALVLITCGIALRRRARRS